MPELPNEGGIQSTDMMAAMMESMRILMQPIVTKIDNIGAKQTIMEEASLKQAEVMSRLMTRMDQHEKQSLEISNVPPGARGRGRDKIPEEDGILNKPVRSRSERRNGRSRSKSSKSGTSM